MWNRSELKSNAKLALKANYWKAVLVGLILSFILGSGSTAAVFCFVQFIMQREWNRR